MKTWSIVSNLTTLSLGAWLAACSSAEMNGAELVDDVGAADGFTSESFDVVEHEVTACDDHQYDHWRYLSALAVAAANELGRWHPADFALVNNSVQLSSTGSARCTEGCLNIRAILQMQDSATSFVPRHDPQLLRNILVSYLDRQKNFNISNPVPDHTLTLSHVSDDECGLRYHFKVNGASGSSGGYGGTTELKAVHSNRCVDVAYGSTADGGGLLQYDCWGGANQKFTIDSAGNGQYRLKNVNSGKCLGVVGAATHNGAAIEQRSCGANDSQTFLLNRKNAGQFEVKNVKSGKCLDVVGVSTANYAGLQIYSCSGGSNQTFLAPGVQSGGSSAGVSPAALYHQLMLFGQNENRYLRFASTATEVSIDPMGTLVDGGSSAASGACFEGSTAYSPTNIGGACCVVSGTFGKMQRSPLNTRMYFCK